MSANRLNWGVISTGEGFEALVHALVFADDHQAKLMDRPGKDKSVDALSGNGAVVYQAKYGANMSMDDAISLARGEMVKIERHLGHEDKTWVKVKKWVLYAAIHNNTWDYEKWDEFNGEFEKRTGIVTECRGTARIEQQLLAHPEIERAFFEGRNRCLLYANETRTWLEELSYKGSFLKTPYLGREDLTADIKKALNESNVRIAVVTGRAEVGRTRFLYETMIDLAADGVRTYWGLVDSMKSSATWFDGIPLGERVIIFVDDCESQEILRCILNQMPGRGREKIQYVISCPDEAYAKISPTIRSISKVKHIVVKPFDADDMSELIKGYDSVHLRPDEEGTISSFANGYPGWAVLCLAAKEVQDGASVMVTAGDVINRLLREIPDRLCDKAKTFLRWLSLWGEVDFERKSSKEAEDFLADKGVGVDLLDDVKRILASTGLIRRITVGGDLCRVISRIVSHQVLLEWLLEYGNGQPLTMTHQGKTLLEELISGRLPYMPQTLATLSTLSVSHLPGAQMNTFIGPILDSVSEWLRSRASLSAADENSALAIVENVGISDFDRALGILKFVWDTKGTDIKLKDQFGYEYEVTHGELCAQIPLLTANMAESVEDCEVARKYFEFLLRLLEEGISRGIDFGNETPAALLSKLIVSSREGNPFHFVVYNYLITNQAAIASSKVMQSLMEWMFTVRLSRTYLQTRYRFVFERAYATKGTEMWHYRDELRKWLLGAILSDANAQSRCVYWKLLKGEHAALTAAISDYDRSNLKREDKLVFEDVLDEDIKAVKNFLEAKTSEIELDELATMRRIWEVHLLEYVSEAPNNVKTAAKFCENIYRGKLKYNVYDIFTNDYASTEQKTAIKEIVAKLLSSADEQFLTKFFETATKYLIATYGNDETDFGATEEIAIGLYEAMPNYRFGDDSLIDKFVRGLYAGFCAHSRLERNFAVHWTRMIFKASKAIAPSLTQFKEEWGKIEALARSKEEMRALMSHVFSRCNDKATGPLCEWELDRLDTLELEGRDQANIVPAYYSVAPAKAISMLSSLLSRDYSDVESIRNVCDVMLFRLYVASFQKVISVDSHLLEWLFDVLSGKNLLVKAFSSHHFESLFGNSNYKYPLKRLVGLLDKGVHLDRDFNVADYFTIGDDESSYGKIFEMMLGDERDSYTRKYVLPKFLIALDINLNRIKKLVVDSSRQYAGDILKLKRIALFAGCFDNTTPEWRDLAQPVSDAAVAIPEQDRMPIYINLNPLIYTWGGTVGHISPDIINRIEIAKRALSSLPQENSLRGYWKLELSLATDEYNREAIEIAREAND